MTSKGFRPAATLRDSGTRSASLIVCCGSLGAPVRPRPVFLCYFLPEFTLNFTNFYCVDYLTCFFP